MGKDMKSVEKDRKKKGKEGEGKWKKRRKVGRKMREEKDE